MNTGSALKMTFSAGEVQYVTKCPKMWCTRRYTVHSCFLPFSLTLFPPLHHVPPLIHCILTAGLKGQHCVFNLPWEHRKVSHQERAASNVLPFFLSSSIKRHVFPSLCLPFIYSSSHVSLLFFSPSCHSSGAEY